MWIDTHCHLDADQFGLDGAGIAQRALTRGVSWIVIPAVSLENFGAVQALSHTQSNCVYALGIHPLFVPDASPAALIDLRARVREAISDPRFVAIGEIGLDFFIPALCTPAMRDKQQHFYSEQLKIAQDFGLPVLLHVRRSQDLILKYLRRIPQVAGIAHAFNGSVQQATMFVHLGFKLGFGGAMTFPRALQIRKLAASMPLSSLVVETDAPDISPSWIHPQRNSPEYLPEIGVCLAGILALGPNIVATQTTQNAYQVLPRLEKLAL